ncbi:zinc-binding dehydrogenase [Flavobacteriaceae bacterium TP-CH-4]|uniref:Zinc-binding dehydrogenase n=1 Tax=Pelagihabitans pacificus TaxID=2696054 RepID=A0A967E5N6_9FLAO|nr:zinc-binding dehydrogenase [Pelagihabitans pacificus]NHF59612.1 zinc-binding dehydrogenase [Pelagihabitans pacificus]
MRAAHLVKYGPSATAFEIRDIEKPKPAPDQVLIQVEAFGLNFADVMARLGLYKGAPPIPTVLGYDVVGRIAVCGENVEHLQEGDRVTALTRFGGYAEYAVAEKEVVYKIPENLPPGVAVALATQYSTAYFLSHHMANLQENDKVLIHAAAGGVGTALTQMALHKKCIVFGTCSSPEKIAYLRTNGVQYPLNYKQNDFGEAVRKIIGKSGLDVIFDPMGGKSVKKGYRLLGAGGRIVSYGVSSMNKTNSIFGKLRVLAQFGVYHPVQFLSQSKGMIGVNMLKLAEEHPEKVAGAMKSVIHLTEQGILEPHVGGEYPITELAQAHSFLESRKSMGKIVVGW